MTPHFNAQLSCPLLLCPSLYSLVYLTPPLAPYRLVFSFHLEIHAFPNPAIDILLRTCCCCWSLRTVSEYQRLLQFDSFLFCVKQRTPSPSLVAFLDMPGKVWAVCIFFVPVHTRDASPHLLRIYIFQLYIRQKRRRSNDDTFENLTEPTLFILFYY